MFSLKMYSGQNILNINASDRCRYACKVLDALFTKEEQKSGSIEPNGTGVFSSLDKDKLKILKGNTDIKDRINQLKIHPIYIF